MPLEIPPARPADEIRKILLKNRRKRRIVHALHFEAPLMAVVPAGVQELLHEIGRLERIARLQKQVAAQRLRVGKIGRACMAVGGLEIGSWPPRHQQIPQNPMLDDA